MPGVSLYLTDINKLPDEIQKLLPIEQDENWFDTYRRLFPNSEDKALFIILPSKARLLNALKHPFALEASDNHQIRGNEFTFIVDPSWAPDGEQSILNDKNTLRLSLGMKNNELTEVIPLQLNINTNKGMDPLSNSTISQSEEHGLGNRPSGSRSVERTQSDQNKDERRIQQQRINELKSQLDKLEIEKDRYEQTMMENREDAMKMIMKREKSLEDMKTNYGHLLTDKQQQIQDQQRQIEELENTLTNIQLNEQTLHNTTTRMKHPSVNIGKIQLPIHDESVSDIYDTLEKMRTIIKFAAKDKATIQSILFGFIQKNGWENLINSNPLILEDFEILRKELVDRYKPVTDDTEQYIATVQRAEEDEKDYLTRLERAYKMFMKLDITAPLPAKHQEAVKARFVTTLAKKEIRIQMKNIADQLQYNQLAERARKFRRVLETENKSTNLISTVTLLQSQMQDMKNQIGKIDDESEDYCKLCRLPHKTSECHASDKFRRKSNKRFYPPSRQSYSIPQSKLEKGMKPNNIYPSAEPENDKNEWRERTGRTPYRYNNQNWNRNRSGGRYYGRNGRRNATGPYYDRRKRYDQSVRFKSDNYGTGPRYNQNRSNNLFTRRSRSAERWRSNSLDRGKFWNQNAIRKSRWNRSQERNTQSVNMAHQFQDNPMSILKHPDSNYSTVEPEGEQFLF